MEGSISRKNGDLFKIFSAPSMKWVLLKAVEMDGCRWFDQPSHSARKGKEWEQIGIPFQTYVSTLSWDYFSFGWFIKKIIGISNKGCRYIKYAFFWIATFNTFSLKWVNKTLCHLQATVGDFYHFLVILLWTMNAWHNQLIIIIVTKYLQDSRVVNSIESKWYLYLLNWEKWFMKVKLGTGISQHSREKK